MNAEVQAPAQAFAPGEYLRDELEERGWSEAEFAEMLGRPVQAVSEILNGHKQIVPETAIALGQALGTSAEIWLNLQTAFALCRARSEMGEHHEVSRRAKLRAIVPIAELRNRGWLPKTSNLEELESAVMDLLSIADLDNVPAFAAAARRSNTEIPFTPSQRAWLAQVRRIAAGRSVGQFDVRKMVKLAGDLVHRLRQPSDLAQIEFWLADCGVIVVNLLPLRSSKLDGAVMMLDDSRPVIGLTTRGNRMDGYVFTLLHELAHISLGHLRSLGTRADEEIAGLGASAGPEAAASRRAAAWILPEDVILPLDHATLRAVDQVADRYAVHPSLVVGRIQRTRQDWRLLRRSIPAVRSFVQVTS